MPLLLAAIVRGALLAGAIAQSDGDVAPVRAWAESSLAEAYPAKFLDNSKIVYENRLGPSLSLDDLRAIDQEIAGKPDHPKREIAETEHRRRVSPDVVVVTVFWGSSGRWHICRDFSSGAHEQWRFMDETLMTGSLSSVHPL